MLAYIARRVLWILPIWLFVTLIAFSIMHIAPGSPAYIVLGLDAPQEAVVELERQLGLDQPVYIQYGNWLLNILQGDLGMSILLNRPVGRELMARFPITLTLALGSIVIAILVGLPLGLAAAQRPNGLLDTTVMGFSMLGLSTPEFLIGLGLMYVFAIQLRVLPVAGYVAPSQSLGGWFTHMLMPWAVLGFMRVAHVARITRATVLEALAEDYVRTARAKGVSRGPVLFRHALRPALVPIVAVVGLGFVVSLGGAFITEVIFRVPGIGLLTISAVRNRDFTVVQGAMLFLSTLVVVCNLLVDVSYAYIDPRIRYD